MSAVGVSVLTRYLTSTLSSLHFTQPKLTSTPDGVLNLEMAQILARGAGHVHGIDSSPAMIAAATAAAASANLTGQCTFEGRSSQIFPTQPNPLTHQRST
jgi:hypothetical protein